MNDEPYAPAFDNVEDNQAALRATGNTSPNHEERRLSIPTRPRTLVEPPTGAYKEQLEELKAKLESGEILTGEEIRRLTQRALIDLLSCGRSSHRIAALRLLQSTSGEKKDPPIGGETGPAGSTAPELNLPKP